MLVGAHLLQHKFRHVRSTDFDSIRRQKIDGSAVLAGSRGIHQPHRTNAYPVQVIAIGQDVFLGLSYIVVISFEDTPDDLLVDERLAWIGHRPDRYECNKAADVVFAHGQQQCWQSLRSRGSSACVPA